MNPQASVTIGFKQGAREGVGFRFVSYVGVGVTLACTLLASAMGLLPISSRDR